MNDDQKNMRVCLLTGAGGTLGSELCKSMDRKYLVSAVCGTRLPEVDSQETRYISPLRPTETAEPTTFVIEADLENESQILRIVELTLARFGKIDLLINNAVVYSFGSMVEGEKLLEDATRQFEINTLLPLRLAATVARLFWRQRRRENLEANRNIINVSSISAENVYENRGQSVYAASKAALNCLTLHMASEFSKFGVRANAVVPTTFPAIVPTSRVAEEILRLDADTISGSLLRIDKDDGARSDQERAMSNSESTTAN